MGDRYDRRRRRLALDPGNLPVLAAFLFDPDYDSAAPPPFGIGHNNGPPLESVGWAQFCWRQAHARAWKIPPIEVVRLRMKRAEELGMSYREYTAVILDKGVYL
jgi:hypothetical protein